jgi:hypothetical protein
VRLACLQSLVTDIDTAPTEMPADTNPLGLPAVVAISVGEVIVTVAATKEDAVTAAEPMVEVIAMVMSAKAIGGMPAATPEMAIAAEVAASGAAAKTAASQVAATHVTAAAEGAASVAAAMASSAIAAAEAAAATVATTATTAASASAAPFGEGIVG